MIRFNSDYLEGAHPRIMEALLRTNMEQTVGYGCDEYCEEAKSIIKKLCKDENADVHLLVGGTQTNLTVIAAALRPHQGVLCAATGHINCHETGAIEATGHKVIPLPTENGKITAKDIEEYVFSHYRDPSHEHVVQPKLVYISFPTETGSIYTKAELTAISRVCREKNLTLFLDGARLGYGLASKENDLTIEDIYTLTDVFYIGGTKVGALFGEAVVISKESLKEDFRYMIKNRGAMLAKGRLLGIQFAELLRDGLYFEISKHAMDLAQKLKASLSQLGYEFYGNSPTNQQFIIVTEDEMNRLSEKFSFEIQEFLPDGNIVIRFCTSWATTEENVDALIAELAQYR